MSNGSEELAIALATMSRDLLSQRSVQLTLDRICEHAVRLVDGCEHAGILTLHGAGRGRRAETLSVTHELVTRSDQIQVDLGEGPCLDAAQHREQAYRISDMTSTPHWPRYAAKARDLGIGSMMGFLLYTEEDELGALNLYSSRPAAFTEHSELIGWIMASHAAVAFSSARVDSQLHAAVATRQLIGEAIGIVMERYKISEDQAFDVLRTSSQHGNVKLRDVAEQVTTTGEIPGAR
ncbi:MULTISPECIES: GAF and ANTAR domain-containing protein [unclassified Saccharopolyspora]|uniref:GAF and ANTAR domain-containing protein n=1 Tax=unclassified Saccharopolyspora TaxID=2646250 RepID=UPI001CD6FC10|nr:MULTISPECIES: GAF and ANTAR domain-containing protein [unclassified Saccharopolyspora]MCA1190984.1 GAF and ANTAR domain-containing protein [Saccharopolyspora sp. 6V]MCA1227636.1 GAF and ANTAR domain-containing protein [Saccharopolyspora sp. 6M]